MTLLTKGSRSLLFLHVPKCAGSSVVSLFKENGYFSTLETRGIKPHKSLIVSPQHQTCENLKSMVNMENLDDTFILVRNPYDRILSEYNWHFRDEEAKNKPDLNSWVIESLQKAQQDLNYADNHFRPAVDFIDTNLPCSIFKLEDGLDLVVEYYIREDYSRKKITVPWEKNSRNFLSPTYNPNLDDLTIQEINNFYNDDFEAFGYKPIRIKSKINSTNSNSGKEARIKAISRLRETTLTNLHQKIQSGLNIFYYESKRVNVSCLNSHNEKELDRYDIEKLSRTIFLNLTFRLDFIKHELDRLIASYQDEGQISLPEMVKLINQYRNMIETE